MVRGKDIARNTTRLPAALRAELGIEDGALKKRRGLFSVSARKAARKEQRRSKHAARKPTPKQSIPPTQPQELYRDTKRTRLQKKEPETSVRVDSITGSTEARQEKALKGLTALERMTQGKSVHERRSKTKLSSVEQDEENEIAWLEHQLYGRKGKMDKEGDDLDDLLDDLDRFRPGMYDDQEEKDGEFEEDEEDLESLEEEEEEEEEDEEEDDEEEEEEEEDSDSSVKEDAPESDMEEGAEAMPSANTAREVPTPMPSVSAGSKYVPPALRAASGDALALAEQKLRRHINGQLNRLAEGNLDSIVTELDGLYRSYARNQVTSNIIDLCLDTVAARTNLTEQIVVLYAAVLTAMHRVIGTEFGAHTLQACITRFLQTYGELIRASMEGKQVPDETASAWSRTCVNIVMLLCHLFNLKLLSAGVIYDLVRLFLGQSFTNMIPGVKHPKSITETDIELLLRIAQSCGAQLRHADAEALMAIVDLTQKCMHDTGKELLAQSSRARFMLEALVHLRQKGKQLARESSATSDSVQRLNKYITGLERRRTVRAFAALQVGLQDLQDAETRGRWWLVGAAWTGRESELETTPAASERTETVDTGMTEEPGVDMAGLARTQGMNTDARRAVFSTLMTSLDFRDAAHNLMQLKLNDVQQREVIRVLVHCLTNERTFNPFYVLVGQQLAHDNVSMRVTMQYVLWDYFREIGEKHVGGQKVVQDDNDDNPDYVLTESHMRRLVHMARAYGFWLATQALSLAALKPVDFTALKRAGTLFLQHMLVHMLLGTQTRVPIMTPKAKAMLTKAPSRSDRERVEQVLVRGTVGQPALARGLFVFCNMHMKPDVLGEMIGDPAATQRLVWAVGVAQKTLNVGASSAAADDPMTAG